jgi:hypothetical protein
MLILTFTPLYLYSVFETLESYCDTEACQFLSSCLGNWKWLLVAIDARFMDRLKAVILEMEKR